MPVFDAAIDAGLAVVHTRHEGAATHMADAWGRLTGDPGIALFTGGPGHANGVGPLFTALGAESPLLMLSGHAPLDHVGLDGFQEMRQADMAAPAAKASWTATRIDTLGTEVARAIRLARSGRPGPVHLSVPSDLFEATLADGDSAIPDASAFTTIAAPLDDAIATVVIAQLTAAKRPLIITGPMMANGRARELREALAQASGIPVLFMESPRGLADPALGALADVLGQTDLVLLLGKKLDFTLRFGRAPTFSDAARFIQIDPEAHALQRASLAIDDRTRILFATVADTLPAAEALLRAAQRAHPAVGGWAREVEAALRYRPESWASLASREDAVQPLEVAQAVHGLVQGIPNAVFVSDGGEFCQWLQARVNARTRITNGPGGAIGGGVPFAIGARAAQPDSPIILATGDGSFGYHLAEFETAARLSLPFVAIVGNDACWNAEYQIQLRNYGRERALGCEMTKSIRYDQVVTPLGGHGEYVTRGAELTDALNRALRSGKPACVNVMIERIAAPALSMRAGKPSISAAS